MCGTRENDYDALGDYDMGGGKYSEKPRYCFGLCSFCPFMVLVVMSTACILILIALAVLLPLMFAYLLPQQAQASIDGAHIEFTSVVLSSPSTDTIHAKNKVELSNAGDYSATIHSAKNVKLYYRGQKFGVTSLPKVDVKGGKDVNAKFTQDADIEITDADVFRESAASLLLGGQVVWEIDADIDVDVFGIEYDLDMDSEVVIDGVKLNVTVSDVNTIYGAGDTIIGNFTQSVFNPGIVSMEDMGDFVFNMEQRNQVLGTATVKDFHVGQGNSNITNVTNTLVRTKENSDIMDAFFSNFLNGVNQTVKITGPITAKADFLLNIMEQDVLVEGSPDKAIVKAVINDPASSAITNPMQTTHNMLYVPINQTQVNMRVTMVDDYIGFVSTAFSANCSTSKQLPIFTGLEPNVQVPARTELPIEVTPVGSTKPCNIYRGIAACCYQFYKAKSYDKSLDFPVNTNGTVLTYVDKGFEVLLSVNVSQIPIVCELNDQLPWDQVCKGFIDTMCLGPEGTYCNSSNSFFPYEPPTTTTTTTTPEPTTTTTTPEPTTTTTTEPTTTTTAEPTTTTTTTEPTTTTPEPTTSEPATTAKVLGLN